MLKSNIPKEEIKLWNDSYMLKQIYKWLDVADTYDLSFIFLYLRNLYDINGKGVEGNCNLMLDYQIIFGNDDDIL